MLGFTWEVVFGLEGVGVLEVEEVEEVKVVVLAGGGMLSFHWLKGKGSSSWSEAEFVVVTADLEVVDLVEGLGCVVEVEVEGVEVEEVEEVEAEEVVCVGGESLVEGTELEVSA